MKEKILLTYQDDCIKAIQKAVDEDQKYMTVELPQSVGKWKILIHTINLLITRHIENILIVSKVCFEKERIEHELSISNEREEYCFRCNIKTISNKELLSSVEVAEFNYDAIIFYDDLLFQTWGLLLNFDKSIVIIFSSIDSGKLLNDKVNKNVIFSYTYEQALTDGIITPAMGSKALESATILFTKRLLEKLGYECRNQLYSEKTRGWDLIAYSNEIKIGVECKWYKSQVISPSMANDILKKVVMQRHKMDVKNDEISFLIIFNKIPSLQKSVVYEHFKIVVLDIDNLVYYAKNDFDLLKLLSQIAYYPIDYIVGEQSQVLKGLGVLLDNKVYSESTKKIEINSIDKENEEANRVADELEQCIPGRNEYREFELLCEKALRILFETKYFNKLNSQYKTQDEHFRMDLIGSLKINQESERGMHPLLQMFVQHYNTHFVVFEFKNYDKELDQNLIYITEKYLFDAALRNVAIIISPNGFSNAAKFAAEGCLKEDGKLIIDLKKGELINLLRNKDQDAADFVLEKIENFLLSISK